MAALILWRRTLRRRQGSHLSVSHSDYVAGPDAEPETLSSKSWWPLPAARGPGHALHHPPFPPPTPPPKDTDWLLVKLVVTVLQPWERAQQQRKCAVSLAPLIKPVSLLPLLKPGDWRSRELSGRPRGPWGPALHGPGQPGGKALLAARSASLPIPGASGEQQVCLPAEHPPPRRPPPASYSVCLPSREKDTE